MAEGRRDKADKAKGAEAGAAECAKAREALAAGDNRRARELARAVLQDEAAGPAAKDEARRLLQAGRVDSAALGTGLVVLAIVVALFYLFTRG